MELRSILNLLSDGEFHSGSDLGRTLGVSRTAVWKALGQLEELRLPLESVKGRGYRLLRPLDLLCGKSIQSYMAAQAVENISIEVLLSTDSTNTHLLEKQLEGNLYESCLAEYQTAGKGRRGRKWVSPFARNIYLSIAFNLDGGAEALSGLSLVVGLSVVKTLASLGVSGVELKWPNDVWLSGRKLAGILVELHGEATTSWRVVVGLGLNVDMRPEDAEVIEQAWSALSEVSDIGRNELAGNLLSGLYCDLERFKLGGFKDFLSDWNKFDALAGKVVEINSGAIVGIARGVDLSGALLLEVDGALSAVNAGEVSVRLG